VQRNLNQNIDDDEVISIARAFIDKDIEETDLPKEWDWRKVMGHSFVPPVRDQGPCGSCYTLSILAVLESRIRIKYAKIMALSP